MAYQTVDAIDAMARGGAPSLRELKADGGATVNGWLMQFQADILGVPVVVPEVEQTTALGAASLAAVGAGLWSQDRVVQGWRERCRYEPAMGVDERAQLMGGWERAVQVTRSQARGNQEA
jgi:glycerol kinase